MCPVCEQPVLSEHPHDHDGETNVHGFRVLDVVTARDCCEISAVLRRELDEGEGTPEWRAWVDRAARRYGLRQEAA